MRIRTEYQHLIRGSKVGAGVQGPTDLGALASTVDRILVLDHDIETYVPTFGERAWVRILHDSRSWQDAAAYAHAIAPTIARAYDLGCRDVIFGNEQIALEGLGQHVEDYMFLNDWGCNVLTALRRQLPGAIRYWGPALSPGHEEDDGIEGYRFLADYLQALDGIAAHYYWGPTWGFFDHADFAWWAGRLERAFALIEGDLGIVKPWAVTEFNRKVNRGNVADVALYAEECKRYYRWLNSQDYVVAGFTFLYTALDPTFYDLTWVQMPTMVERMQDGWDRRAEGEFAVPTPPPAPPGERSRFVLGFAQYAAGRDWMPLEDERPDAFGNAYQRAIDSYGNVVLLRYDKASNTITEYWER